MRTSIILLLCIAALTSCKRNGVTLHTPYVRYGPLTEPPACVKEELKLISIDVKQRAIVRDSTSTFYKEVSL